MQEIVEHEVNHARENHREYDVETPCSTEEPVEEHHEHKGERDKWNKHEEYGVKDYGSNGNKQLGQIFFLSFVLLEIFLVVSQVLNEKNCAEQQNDGADKNREISWSGGPVRGSSRETKGGNHEK
jgi:hypothetical protein